MSLIDFLILIIYLTAVFLVGVYFYRKNSTNEDYFVGNRSIGAWHIGLSVVATDVGGGFSIGLGGLGFVMGLSGSWLLFTGLVGAWMAAVLIIPIIKKIDKKNSFMTFPDFLRHTYGNRVALVAAIISAIGYTGFTGGQISAGAKLSASTLFSDLPLDIDPMVFSIVVIALVILIYTVLGGLKAVIYTDTIQWIVLMAGLLFFAVPFTIMEVGGMDKFMASLPAEFFTLTNLSISDILNWSVTIIPIWFIAMTLYQRIYAAPNKKEAQKAWFIAGIFEYPIMAFSGVFLGMASRIFFENAEPETGLPLLLGTVLPIGIKGLVISAYFSAIMSTADSCLIAASGTITGDIIGRIGFFKKYNSNPIKTSQIITLIIGLTTIFIAVSFESVLEIILHSYSVMVSGLFFPTIAAYFFRNKSEKAALASMIAGGLSVLILIFSGVKLPLGLDPVFGGLVFSLAAYLIVLAISKKVVNDV